MESALKRNSSVNLHNIFPHSSVLNNTIFTVIFMFHCITDASELLYNKKYFSDNHFPCPYLEGIKMYIHVTCCMSKLCA